MIQSYGCWLAGLSDLKFTCYVKTNPVVWETIWVWPMMRQHVPCRFLKKELYSSISAVWWRDKNQSVQFLLQLNSNFLQSGFSWPNFRIGFTGKSITVREDECTIASPINHLLSPSLMYLGCRLPVHRKRPDVYNSHPRMPVCMCSVLWIFLNWCGVTVKIHCGFTDFWQGFFCSWRDEDMWITNHHLKISLQSSIMCVLSHYSVHQILVGLNQYIPGCKTSSYWANQCMWILDNNKRVCLGANHLGGCSGITHITQDWYKNLCDCNY